jgi:hypothetical protein
MRRGVGGAALDGVAGFWSSGGDHHSIDDGAEIAEAGDGDDDGVAVAADVFGYSQELPSLVFFEVEEEGFSFDDELFALNGVIHDDFPCLDVTEAVFYVNGGGCQLYSKGKWRLVKWVGFGKSVGLYEFD